jgi:membrane fusion protein (multidrug efflux system)
MSVTRLLRTDRLAIIALLAFSVACSGKGNDAGTAQAATPGGAGGGQRRNTSITLSAADVQKVQRRALDEGIAVTGNLEPIETVEVRARLEGDLVAVYVREGERVAQGQLLARFEAGEQTSGRASAVADVTASRGDLTTAQWNLDQSRELFKAGAIPERDVRVAEQTFATAQARLAAANARLNVATTSEQDTRVVAPTSGVVATRLVENGESVARGASLFTIVRTETLELRAAVPATQSGGIRVGQPVHFSAAGRDFEGRVARVNPTIDPASRSVTVYVQVPNASGALRGGTFASGRIVIRTVPDALVIASAALRQSQGGGPPIVYRVADQQLEPVTVETGVTDQELALTQITKGLREGDVVVIGNVGTLGKGMKVVMIGTDAGAQPADTGRQSTGGR